MRFRHFLLGVTGTFGLLFAFPAFAAPSTLTLQHKHFLFTIDASDMRAWQRPQEEWTYRGRPAAPPALFRTEGDVPVLPPAGWERRMTTEWNSSAIALTLEKKIAALFDRPAGRVTIGRSRPDDDRLQATASGSIVFDGLGMPGRRLDIPATVGLVRAALERGVAHITLPVEETLPEVTVTDPSLLAAGIKEFVTIGESDFTGSPVNRRHNIAVGVERFNGTFIPQGREFSFNEVLGRVDASTGYRKELVIKGDRTEPDYGGGLCQISTTAYRGVWEYGFPILKRKNHSFAVRYYGPQGTDATVYPGSVDMIFKNDSSGALVLQTYTEQNRAYFLYYGTRDSRMTEIVGPYAWNFREAPPPKTEYTTDIPPGEKKKIGEAVRGMNAAWYRIMERDGKETVERVSSIYEARPLFHQIGVLPEEMPTHSQSGAVTGELRL